MLDGQISEWPENWDVMGDNSRNAGQTSQLKVPYKGVSYPAPEQSGITGSDPQWAELSKYVWTFSSIISSRDVLVGVELCPNSRRPSPEWRSLQTNLPDWWFLGEWEGLNLRLDLTCFCLHVFSIWQQQSNQSQSRWRFRAVSTSLLELMFGDTEVKGQTEQFSTLQTEKRGVSFLKNSALKWFFKHSF